MAAPMDAMDLCVDLGTTPVDSCSGHILSGLQALLSASELCDVQLAAGGQTFCAHSVVLAAVSGPFRELLLRMSSAGQEGGLTKAPPFIVELEGVSHAESVQAMLACIYGRQRQEGEDGGYCPSSDGVNRDIIRLAQRFNISQLESQASQWLVTGLNTSNVLDRLMVCEEFGLTGVREKILEQLTANPNALFVLASNPEIQKVPGTLQELLVRVLQLLGCGSATGKPPRELAKEQPQHGGKRAKKAGA